MVSVILAGIYVLTPPLLILSGVFLSANYVVYLVHMKVLVLMIAIWGFIPFWGLDSCYYGSDNSIYISEEKLKI